MTCNERKDLILEYASGALDAAERDELRAHLASGCPACAGALAEAEATIAHLPLTLPGSTPPASARDKLMQRVLSDSAPTAKPNSGRHMSVQTIFGIVGSLAAIIMLVVAIQYQRRDEHSRAMVSMLKARNLQMVSMAGDVEQPQASGRVMYDRDNRRWHVSVFNLKPLPADKAYELWFIMPGKEPVAAPLIPVDQNGNGSLVLNIPIDVENISVAAITIEKAGGDSSPHSKPQLVGKVE